MTQQNIPSKQVFMLAVDEDRAELFQVMATGLTHDWFEFAHAHPDRAHALLPVMLSFVKDMAEQVHEMGWCKSQNCRHDEPK